MQNLYVKSENRNFSDEDMYEYLNAIPIRIAIDECNPMVYFSNGADSKSSHILFQRAVINFVPYICKPLISVIIEGRNNFQGVYAGNARLLF